MNDDFQLKSYQDDLADDNMPDPFMDEQGDDPSTELRDRHRVKASLRSDHHIVCGFIARNGQ